MPNHISSWHSLFKIPPYGSNLHSLTKSWVKVLCQNNLESKSFMNGGEVGLEINAFTVHRANKSARSGL